MVNAATGEVHALRCKSWRCPICAARKASQHRTRIIVGRPERFITLTAAGRTADEVSRNWNGFLRDVRTEGYAFEFARVVEAEPSGLISLHVAQRGDFIPQKTVSVLAGKNGMGYVADIRRVKGAGQLAGYMAKNLSGYLTKGAARTAEVLGPRKRLVTYSRKWLSRELTALLEAKDEAEEWILVSDSEDGGCVRRAEDLGPEHQDDFEIACEEMMRGLGLLGLVRSVFANARLISVKEEK